MNLDEITIFCCLNCIFECINGFSLLKNPRGTWIIQTKSLKYVDPTLSHQISGKTKQRKSPENGQNVEHLDHDI
jgi:hypothetical protein